MTRFPHLLSARLLLLGLLVFVQSAVALQRDLIKSPNDTREYAYLTLPNQLQVLLISDPQADKAAAAMDVAVGSASDPQDFQGLAHFLEHMLFLGTQRYPDASEYQKFISSHGGSHNAYTSVENTNYFFDIQAGHLKGALDRFSQQFTAPLFNAEYVEREVNAVHSEFTSRIKDDGRRMFDALKETLRPGHPYAGFSVGNLDSLKDREEKSLRQALLDFYADHYAARKMRLVVLGREPLPTLRDWVQAKFSQIPNPADVKERATFPPFFADDYLPAKVEIQSIMDKRSLTVAFPVPSALKAYRAQPIGYLSNLLGHEGEGSLLSALKAEQLVDSLASGGQFDNPDQALLTVRMGLTEQGLANQERILELLFAYIELLKQDGIRKQYFDEQATMLEISFRYMEKSEPIHLVSGLASALQHYPAREVLHAAYDLSDYNPTLYNEFLQALRPDNMLWVVMHKGVESERKSPWYETPWKQEKLSPDLLARLQQAQRPRGMHLPANNQFIPEDTSLIQASPSPKPEQLLEKPGLTLWHATDVSFGTPRSSLFVTLRSPLALRSADDLNKTELMVSLFKEVLNEFSYPALLAGLDAELYNHMRGVTLKISGYNDKQSVLLQEVLLTMLSARFPQDRFDIARERLQRSLQNAKQRAPYEQVMARLQRFLIDPSWTEEERLAALDTLTLEQVQQFKEAFFKELDVVVMQSGNVSRAASLNIANMLEQLLLREAKPTQVARPRIVELNDNSLDEGLRWGLPYDVEHPDTGFIHYLQGRDRTLEEQARFMLLAQLLASDYYAQIRTEKQLGYIVFGTSFELLEVPGLAFIVQSPSATASTLAQETEAFLSQQASSLPKLDLAQFDRQKQALISQLEKQENSIYERNNRYWQEIDRENDQFNTRERLITLVREQTREGLAEFFAQLLTQRGKALVVYSDRPKNQSLSGTQEIGSEQMSRFGRFETGH